MKYTLLLSLLVFGLASASEKKDDWVEYSPDYVTNKWIRVSMTDEKCISIAQDIASKSDKIKVIKLTGNKYKSATVTGKFSLKIDCIESANRVHLLTDKVKETEHQQLFDMFVNAYEKFNQAQQ